MVNVRPTPLAGVLVFEPRAFSDERGFFMETYNQKVYASAGLDRVFVQDNFSRSKKGVLRGLHYQQPFPQAKFVYVISGEVFDVAVDIRRGSPTYGQWHGEILSSDNRRQMYIPEGFAHGFCVLSEQADFVYKCTDVYHPETDRGINWSDSDIGISWPVTHPILSAKDSGLPPLCDLSHDSLPSFHTLKR